MTKTSDFKALSRTILTVFAVLAMAPGLTGCYLAEGAAQLVKMAGKKSGEDKGSAPTAQSTAAPQTTAEEPPPPLSEGTQPAVSVKVEELPSR